MTLIINILAVYNLAFGIFHLFFWKLLRWKEQLKHVLPVNRALMQTLNICLTFMFFLIGFYLLAYSADFEQSGLGQALLVGLALFWLLRTVLQVLLFNLNETIHKILLFIFALGTILHFFSIFL